MMVGLRAYLLVGLIGHKVLWEVLKRRGQDVPSESPSPGPRSWKTQLVKLMKITILLAIVAQTLVPDTWLPEWLFLTGKTEPGVRIVGVIFYSLGLFVAVLGRLQLGGNWANIETATVLQGQAVVSRGVYRFIRHPIYVGDLLLLLGFEMALNCRLILAVALLIPVVLRQATREEKMLRQSLAGYGDYCLVTKRFIPFVF